MEILNVKYQTNGFVVNNQFFIPKNESDLDYQNIKLWIEAGGVVEPEFSEEELLYKAKYSKKLIIKSLRTSSLGGDLLAKVENGNSYYVTTRSEINIFQSAVLSMINSRVPDNSTRRWGGYLNGVKVSIVLTKEELLSLSNHYEERKNLAYNLCDDRRAAVDALSTIEEVEAYDINSVDF